MNVILKGCNDQVLYTSDLGESREKEFQKAYTEAVRAAFKSIATLDYKYEPKEVTNVVVSTPSLSQTNNEVSQEIQKLKEEIQTLKEEKKVEVVEVKETKPVVASVTKPEIIKVKEEKVIQKNNQVGLSNILYAHLMRTDITNVIPKFKFSQEKVVLSGDDKRRLKILLK